MKTTYTPAEAKLSASIMLAIEIDSSFKLYSFHIISPEQYVERLKELVGNYQFTLNKYKQSKNEIPNLTIV